LSQKRRTEHATSSPRHCCTVVAVRGSVAAAIATAGTAGASAPFSCTKVSGNIGGTVTLKGCGGGLGKGSMAGGSIATGGVITWKGERSGTTTVGNVSITSPGQGDCAKGSTEEDLTGTVTANTSKADLLGTTVSAQACLDGSGNVSLVKHTTAKL
jgi:hypothetical protein